MHENTRKSFYIFLTMVLGVLLFLMIQRSIFLVAFLLGADVGSVQSEALGVVTTAIAVVFGAWYGVWLGLLWYAAVYEEGSMRGMLHTLWLKRRKSPEPVGSWNLDDLVTGVVDLSKGVDLMYFEKNTVKFGGEPVSASAVHTQHVPVTHKKKSTVTKKTPVRRSVV